ncbi:MAG: S-methyl-5-thioribose-1-phosphate isomerase [Myxococcales bacterium]|nr:S-methyl-5-thioribose-1-phosphate isomerase [Myxococcales bacterium]
MKPSNFRPVAYDGGVLTLLDQTRLPQDEIYEQFKTVEAIALAIEHMVVRGAPAIGLAAAYGIVVAAHRGTPLSEADARLRRTRPTAVNLFWALDRMKHVWLQGTDIQPLEDEAHAIHQEDAANCLRIGEVGAEFIPDDATILTHCNAGALATAEYGTALAVIRAAHSQGKRIRVLADETRPWLQGARLTTWELMRDGINVTLICDSAVAHLAGRGEISCAITGADRIAKNGDVANKIGTRGVACILQMHELPFYVAAPWSTIDLSLETGAQIAIEERSEQEVTHIANHRTAPEGVAARNPAFDITPAAWVSNLFTERGATGQNIAHGLASISSPTL